MLHCGDITLKKMLQHKFSSSKFEWTHFGPKSYCTALIITPIDRILDLTILPYYISPKSECPMFECPSHVDLGCVRTWGPPSEFFNNSLRDSGSGSVRSFDVVPFSVFENKFACIESIASIMHHVSHSSIHPSIHPSLIRWAPTSCILHLTHQTSPPQHSHLSSL